ncbi:MAG: DUF1232 domain-containing protein [Actinomycetota bacterium]
MADTEVFVSNALDESEPPRRRGLSDVAMEGVLLIPNTMKLLTRLVRDPRVSMRRKVPVAAAIGYVVSPIDIIPNSILGLGLLDDAVVVSLALNGLLSDPDAGIIREHWDGSIDALDLAVSLMLWASTLIPGKR